MDIIGLYATNMKFINDPIFGGHPLRQIKKPAKAGFLMIRKRPIK